MHEGAQRTRKYVKLIQDMYRGCQTKVRSAAGESGSFNVDVGRKLAKSTRLPGSIPVFYLFYPSTRFFKFLPVLGIPIYKKKLKKLNNFVVLFLPVNIGEIRELINHFRSYRP